MWDYRRRGAAAALPLWRRLHAQVSPGNFLYTEYCGKLAVKCLVYSRYKYLIYLMVEEDICRRHNARTLNNQHSRGKADPEEGEIRVIPCLQISLYIRRENTECNMYEWLKPGPHRPSEGKNQQCSDNVQLAFVEGSTKSQFPQPDRSCHICAKNLFIARVLFGMSASHWAHRSSSKRV